MKSNVENFKLSFAFFSDKSKKRETFTLDELATATGWSNSTVRTYVSKKWNHFFIRKGKVFEVDHSSFNYSEDEYLRMVSQVNKYSSNPYKLELPDYVESLVEKAKEAAILAIDIYNRPMTSFRTQEFSVMMIIAWTSLFHAIFEQSGVDYNYYKKDGTVDIVDGEKKAWELGKCIETYQGIPLAVKENIKLFILLRNKIEHRFAPAFDLDICGECQALLLNFEELITSEFGTYYSLATTLSIPLQVITSRPAWQLEGFKQFQSKHYEELKEFVNDYRQGLSDSVFSDSKYSFRVYLIQKTGNHRSSSDMAMEFIKYDPSQLDQFKDIEKGITLIKDKLVQVANQGRLKPSAVCKLVSQQIGKKLGSMAHYNACRCYNIRKQGYQAEGCNTDYCQYDEPHKDYIYTQAWVDFLSEKLSDEEEYKRATSFK